MLRTSPTRRARYVSASRSTPVPSPAHGEPGRREAGHVAPATRGDRYGGDSLMAGIDGSEARPEAVGRAAAGAARHGGPSRPAPCDGRGPRAGRRDQCRPGTRRRKSSRDAAVERGAARGRRRCPRRQRTRPVRPGARVQGARGSRRIPPGRGRPGRGGTSGLPGRRRTRAPGTPGPAAGPGRSRAAASRAVSRLGRSPGMTGTTAARGDGPGRTRARQGLTARCPEPPPFGGGSRRWGRTSGSPEAGQ